VFDLPESRNENRTVDVDEVIEDAAAENEDVAGSDENNSDGQSDSEGD
jgi:hypothetical protein